VLESQSPAAVLVVGDVNSTIACALVAAKKHIPVIHVEAGLRSFDRSMPEEINRVLTDQLSELLFITEPSARANLLREGIAEQRIFHVGNVMIDTLRRCQSLAVPVKDSLADLDDKDVFLNGDMGYCVLTLHRPSNVDNARVFRQILETVRMVSEEIPVIFPIHPRTRNRIADLGLQSLIESHRIAELQPLGYLEMLGLVSDARLVMTDSGRMARGHTIAVPGDDATGGPEPSAPSIGVLALQGDFAAHARMIESLGAHVAGIAFLVELSFLQGRKLLEGYDIYSLIKYESE